MNIIQIISFVLNNMIMIYYKTEALRGRFKVCLNIALFSACLLTYKIKLLNYLYAVKYIFVLEIKKNIFIISLIFS